MYTHTRTQSRRCVCTLLISQALFELGYTVWWLHCVLLSHSVSERAVSSSVDSSFTVQTAQIPLIPAEPSQAGSQEELTDRLRGEEMKDNEREKKNHVGKKTGKGESTEVIR